MRIIGFVAKIRDDAYKLRRKRISECQCSTQCDCGEFQRGEAYAADVILNELIRMIEETGNVE